MVARTRLVRVLTAVTDAPYQFSTERVRPSGVSASACSEAPTRIARPARPVAVLIGVTVPDPD